MSASMMCDAKSRHFALDDGYHWWMRTRQLVHCLLMVRIVLGARRASPSWLSVAPGFSSPARGDAVAAVAGSTLFPPSPKYLERSVGSWSSIIVRNTEMFTY